MAVTWHHGSREELAAGINQDSVEEQIDAVVKELTAPVAPLRPLPRPQADKPADSPGKSTTVHVIVADDPHPENPGEPVFNDSIIGIYSDREQAIDQVFTRARRQPHYDWYVSLWDASTSTVLGNVVSISSNRGAGHFDPLD